MLRNFSKKLTPKFPVITLSYTMVKTNCGNDAFSEIFEMESVDGQSLLQKKKTQTEGQKGLTKPEKPKDISHFFLFYFCTCPCKNVVKRGEKKVLLSCCKCFFEWIAAHLA